MDNSKFFKIRRNKHQLPHNSDPFGITNLELYPRMRHTEFYRQPHIPDEYQSRSFEHPHILDGSEPTWIAQQQREKIIPPTNSDMQFARNSYFS